MKNNTALLHLLLCKTPHSSDLKDIDVENCQKCRWYLEEQLENGWEKASHVKWLKMTENIKELAQLEDEELHKILQKITKVIGELDSLSFGNPSIKEVVNLIVNKALSSTSIHTSIATPISSI